MTLSPTPEPTTEQPTTTPPPAPGASGGTDPTTLVGLGLVLVALLGVGGGVGLYLTRESAAV